MNALCVEAPPTFSKAERDAPSKPISQPKKITEHEFALQTKLQECSGMSHQAQANYLFQEYGVRLSRYTIGREMQWDEMVEKRIFPHCLTGT